MKYVNKEGLFRSSLIYFVGDLISRGITFLLLPIFTSYLSLHEYGIISLALILQTLFSIILSFRGVVNRFYYQYKIGAEREQFIGTFWLFLVLYAGVIILIIIFWGKPIFNRLLPSLPFFPFVPLVLFAVYFDVAFQFVLLDYYQAAMNAKSYTFISILAAAISAGSTFWLVVVTRKGAVGYVQARVISSTSIGIVSAWILFKKIGFKMEWGLIKSALRFGIPLVPHYFFHWILGLSDRVILDNYTTLSQVGIYSLAYQIGLAFQLVFASLNKALVPVFSQASESNVTLHQLPRITTYHVLAVSYLGVIGILLSGPILIILFPLSYHGARPLIPWLIMGIMFVGYYYIPMNIVSMTAGRTFIAPALTFIAGAVNLGLNLFLVPKIGTIAAAYNTSIGYGILLILMSVVAYRLRPLNLEWKRLLKIVLVSLLLGSIGLSLMQFSAWGNFIIGLGIVFVFPICLWGIGFFDKKENMALKNALQRAVNYLGF